MSGWVMPAIHAHVTADWQIQDNPMGLGIPPCTTFVTWYDSSSLLQVAQLLYICAAALLCMVVSQSAV